MSTRTGENRDRATRSPCRLFVYLARTAPIAAVLRRGPSDWTRLSLWRTDTDEVTHGQWLHARVYERRSGLSADGSLFVAFVRDSSRPANRDTWLAVSRPPWFSALALWFVGGTYCAGGFFADDRSLWLGISPTAPDRGSIPDWLEVNADAARYIDRTPNWTERTVWLNRLQRDGWARVDGATPEQWRRRQPVGEGVLTMTMRSESSFATYGGPHVVDYRVRRDDGEERALGRADWADWDPRGRLIVAREGQLVIWTTPGEQHLIADFTSQSPNPEPAPPDAFKWPEPPSGRR